MGPCDGNRRRATAARRSASVPQALRYALGVPVAPLVRRHEHSKEASSSASTSRSGSTKRLVSYLDLRRQRRINAVPEPLRPAVVGFADHPRSFPVSAVGGLGTYLRVDKTIEQTLSIVRDLACFVVGDRAKLDWSTVAITDIEAFLCLQPANRRRRLQSCL